MAVELLHLVPFFFFPWKAGFGKKLISFPPSILPSSSSSNLHPGQLSWLELGVAFRGCLYSCPPRSFESFDGHLRSFFKMISHQSFVVLNQLIFKSRSKLKRGHLKKVWRGGKKAEIVCSFDAVRGSCDVRFPRRPLKAPLVGQFSVNANPDDPAAGRVMRVRALPWPHLALAAESGRIRAWPRRSPTAGANFSRRTHVIFLSPPLRSPEPCPRV